jgi:hypothetical protein
MWRRDKDSLGWYFNRLVLREGADDFFQLTLYEQENLEPYIDMRQLLGFWHEYSDLGIERNAESIWTGIAQAGWLRQQRGLNPAWS